MEHLFAYSQFHFGIKYSAEDIKAQRELFKIANVELAIITDNSGFDEKTTFDRKDKNIEKMSYQSVEENAFDGKSIYEYDIEGKLISIKYESGDAMRPDEFLYDINGNIIRFISEVCEEKYSYYEANELVSSEITKQTIEMSPIETVKYKNGLMSESGTKCWDESVNAPFTYSEIKYMYGTERKVISLLYIYLPQKYKTGVEEVSSETTIDYNEKNLPV